MFHRLRRWLLSRFDEELDAARREVRVAAELLADAVRQRDELAKTLEGVNRTCREVMAERDAAERLLSAATKAIDFSPFDQSWRESPAAAMHAVGAHVDARIAEETRRADDAAARALELQRELTETSHELEKTSKALEVAEEQNLALWSVVERDRARVAAETAILHRKTAESQTPTERDDVLLEGFREP